MDHYHLGHIRASSDHHFAPRNSERAHNFALVCRRWSRSIACIPCTTQRCGESAHQLAARPAAGSVSGRARARAASFRLRSDGDASALSLHIRLRPGLVGKTMRVNTRGAVADAAQGERDPRPGRALPIRREAHHCAIVGHTQSTVYWLGSTSSH
jgi:hypothetical protein